MQPNEKETAAQAAQSVQVAIVGAGPAGLMAAQVLSGAGVAVHVFDAMPSVGRKFLLAGKGGMNLTHAEPLDAFVTRYGAAQSNLEPLLRRWGPQQVRDWAADLGVDTFVGSSQRVFPTDMKAAPLLRAWLQRLRHPLTAGGVPVQFHMRHRWRGWDADGALVFATEEGALRPVRAAATVLALGGGSWARLGSDGAWVEPLRQQGVELAPLQPSNCGFEVHGGWSPFFRDKFAGQPFKSVAIACTDAQGRRFARKGEFVATAHGIEGSLIYAASSLLRDEIAQQGSATVVLDLLPDMALERVQAELAHPRGSRSLSSHLKSRLRLDGIKAAILHELVDKPALADPHLLARAIKGLPIALVAPRPIDEAISSAGGVCWSAVDEHLRLRAVPGMWVAGEMLDWEAPTGGYLLTACLATGWHAAHGVRAVLARA
ncbi:TIGR03862 family flavoprotein [Curvibacter sp. APW13]|uniref:TIGR03862 family flavoprotein n=1 Tax=Curvibacter sp. APW13 TaxID=3077236 RepID=UPI0028DF04DE|nr:TIGR03862 family flavoprotein [Curvibacter sp. APW13]MDT8992218.1 TIGR03862 family flavoprotein [Curvibacter sp. APW13]